MWEFLIKQDSGLYKPKSIANLEFIESYYNFKESQSNADAMLGEILPYTYNGTIVTFEDEVSLPDSGTYFPFAQIDCYNNLQMLAASNTVSSAKADLLAALSKYGEKLVRVIHISTTVPFQPLPGGGVDPAVLNAKQDKILSSAITVGDTDYSTVETTLNAVATNLNDITASGGSNVSIKYILDSSKHGDIDPMETIRINFNAPLSASQKIVGISSCACYNSSNELVEFVISESTIADDGKSIDITFFNSRLITQELDHIDLNLIVVKPSSGGGGSVEPATTTEPGIVQLTEANGSDIYSNPSQYDTTDGNPVVLNATQTKAMITAGTAGSVTPAQLNLKQDKTLSSPLQIDSGNSVTTVETGLSGLRNKIRSTVLFADAPPAGFNIQANANTGDRYCKILDYNGAMNNAVALLIEGRLAVTKSNTTLSDTHIIRANIRIQNNNINIDSSLARALPENFDILISTTGGVYIKVFRGVYDSVMFIGFAAGTFRNYNANNYMASLPAGTVIAKQLSSSAVYMNTLQPKALATPLEIIDSTENTVEGALSTLADITNNAILAQPTRVMFRNVNSDVLYYKLGTLDEMSNPLGNFSGVILDNNIIPKFDITFSKSNNLIKLNGYYYGDLPANTDIIITENYVYLKLPPSLGFLFISEFFITNDMNLVISSATSSLSEEIKASLSVDAIKLTKGGGTNTGYNLISTLTINADPSS